MKKIALVLFLTAITIASLFTISLSNASVTPTLSVDSATQQFPSAHVGDTIQVNITISNVQNLWVWDITYIKFDPTILSLTNLTEGPFLQTSGQQTVFVSQYMSANADYYAKQGIINETSDVMLANATVSGTGVIATMTFKVLATGTSQIILNQPTIEDATQASIPLNVVNANVVVGSSSNLTNNPSPTPTATSTTSSPSTSATTTPTQSSSSPTPKPSDVAPEFPITLIIAFLIIAVTMTTLLMAKKNKHQKE